MSLQTRNYDLTDIICLDIETTGLTNKDEILQLSIIDGTGDVIFNEYIKPKNKTEWPEAAEVNDITPNMVADKPTIDIYIPQLDKIMANAKLLIGYNLIKFDLGFIENAGVKIPSTISIFDVMLEFAEVYGEWSDYFKDWKWQPLHVCADFFGYKGNGNFHDSLEDVRATLYCYFAMQEVKNMKIRLEGTLQELTDGEVELRKCFNVFSVSQPYQNRNSELHRIYFDVELPKKKEMLGITRMPYPENWGKYYLRYENDEINSDEFATLLGLQKETVCSLIERYKTDNKNAAEFIERLAWIYDEKVSEKDKLYIFEWFRKGFEATTIQKAYMETVMNTNRFLVLYADRLLKSWVIKEKETLWPL